MKNKFHNRIYSLPFLRIIPFLLFKHPAKTNLQDHGQFIFPAVLSLFALTILSEYFSIQEGHYFITWGVPSLFCKLFSLVAFYYLFLQNEKTNFSGIFLYSISIEIWVVCLAVLLFLYLTFTKLLFFDINYTYFHAFKVVFQTTTIGFFLYWILHKNFYVLKTYLFAYSSIVALPFVFFNFLSMPFWMGDFEDSYEDYFYIENYDQLFGKQSDLINVQGELLAKGIPQKNELYFLGFASYESQSVFRNEVEHVESLMEKDFHLPNHSIKLINSRETIDSHPLATGGNIQKALSVLESKMNIDEDILFLYLTSHGSADHQLSVSFYPLSLANLTPEMLGSYLKNTKIKWQIIVISACYSGGFVDELKSDNNIVVTAADSTNTSFGCADDREFTYFGEALFKNNFSPEKHLIDTFEHAIEQIAVREKEESLKASNPQMWIGKNIRNHLSEF